ncbi:MAG: cytochrome c-type biogenesis protein CcmH [Bryobacterales bacterium]|nr:cytochrome c-type biogenesis protein CcmH [Bryobacterales bacterium]
MRRFRNSPKALLVVSLLAFSLAPTVFAQSAEQLESPAVNRIADRLNCPCGCKLNMACRMSPYPCQTCWDNKKKILKMEQAGMSDQAILDVFAKEMGPGTVVIPPGLLGSMSFYTAAALGLILVLFVIRKYRRKEAAVAAAQAPRDPLFDRYHDQIEKEVEKLD